MVQICKLQIANVFARALEAVAGMLLINDNQSPHETQTKPAELWKKENCAWSFKCKHVSLINSLWLFIGVYGSNSLQLVSQVSMQLESNGLNVIAELLLFLFDCRPTVV